MGKKEDIEEILHGLYEISRNNTSSLNNLVVVIESLITRVETLESKLEELEKR